MEDEWTFDDVGGDDMGELEYASEFPDVEERPVAFKQGGDKAKYEHKRDRGSLFDNDRKEKETQPDFTGSINVNGTIYWISAWKEMTGSGKRKLSLSVKEQEERPKDLPQPQRSGNGFNGRQQGRQNTSGW